MIKRHLKATFVPHAGNRYKPHLIRRWGLLVAVLVVLGAQGLYNYQTTGQFRVLSYATNVSAGDLLSLTNQQRSSNGSGQLTYSPKLGSAAQAKANHMIANNYWAHVAPDGTTPWDFIAQVGYSYIKAGENLAYGFASSSGVVNGWMNSPSHRANLLDAKFKNVGFGIANGSKYQGGPNTVVVAMYGQPVAVTTTNKVSSPTTPTTTTNTSPAPTKPAPSPSTTRKPATKTKTAKPETKNVHSTLAELSEQPIQVVAGATDGIKDDQAQAVTWAASFLNGGANWSQYAALAVVTVLGLVFAVRHLIALKSFVLHGEHYVMGHPFIEAVLVYGSIWASLLTTYGVVR